MGLHPDGWSGPVLRVRATNFAVPGHQFPIQASEFEWFLLQPSYPSHRAGWLGPVLGRSAKGAPVLGRLLCRLADASSTDAMQAG